MGWQWNGLDLRELPAPRRDDLEAPKLAPDDFHRLAVAHGLSHQRPDIGEIHLPGEIGDGDQPDHRGKPPAITT